jgi:hypothetical protein
MLQSEGSWPLDVMTCFIEDYLGGRSWCDASNCKLLVDNLMFSLRAKPGDPSVAADGVGVGASSGGKQTTLLPEVCNRYPFGASHSQMRAVVNRLLRTRMASGVQNFGQPFEAVMTVVCTSVSHLTEALRTTVQLHGYRTFTRLMQLTPSTASGMLSELDDTALRLLPPRMSVANIRSLRTSDVVLASVLGSVVRSLVVDAQLNAHSTVAPASVTPQSLAKVAVMCLSVCMMCECLYVCVRVYERVDVCVFPCCDGGFAFRFPVFRPLNQSLCHNRLV